MLLAGEHSCRGNARFPTPVGRDTTRWSGHGPWTCHAGSGRGPMTSFSKLVRVKWWRLRAQVPHISQPWTTLMPPVVLYSALHVMNHGETFPLTVWPPETRDEPHNSSVSPAELTPLHVEWWKGGKPECTLDKIYELGFFVPFFHFLSFARLNTVTIAARKQSKAKSDFF